MTPEDAEMPEGEAHPGSYIEPADTPERRQAEAAAFIAWLAEIGETKGSLSRIMVRLGDHRPRRTIMRTLERYASGEFKISGEFKVVMSIFRNSRRRRRATAAAESVGAQYPSDLLD